MSQFPPLESQPPWPPQQPTTAPAPSFPSSMPTDDEEQQMLQALERAEQQHQQQAAVAATTTHSGPPPPQQQPMPAQQASPQRPTPTSMPPPSPRPPASVSVAAPRIRSTHTLPSSLPPTPPSIVSSFARGAAAAAQRPPPAQQRPQPPPAPQQQQQQAQQAPPPQFYQQQQMQSPPQQQMQQPPPQYQQPPMQPVQSYLQQQPQQQHYPPAYPQAHSMGPPPQPQQQHSSQQYPPAAPQYPMQPPAPVPAAAATAMMPSSSSSSSRPSAPPLVRIETASLLELFVHYFPDDWLAVGGGAGQDVLSPEEAGARKELRTTPKFAIVERLSAFFHTYRDKYIMQSDVRLFSRVVLDFPSFCAQIDDYVKNFEQELQSNPTLIIACLQCALHHTCTTPAAAPRDGSAPPAFEPLRFALPFLLVRFRAFRPCVSLKSAVKAARLGQFLCVQGTVVRTAPARPAVQSMQFTCTRCKRTKCVEFKDFIYMPPDGCTPPCNNKYFEPDRLSAHCVDRQVIKLQEIIHNINYVAPLAVNARGAAATSGASSSGSDSPDAARLAASASSAALMSLEDQGRVPRSLEVHLQGADLVDSCIPGDVVSVCGFVRSRKQEQGIRGKNASVFVLYLEANALTKAQGEDTASQQGQQQEDNRLFPSPSSSASAFDPLAEFSPGELAGIQQFVSGTRSPFKMLVASLCPTIFGHEVVKAGLILALLGGVSKNGTTNAKTHADAAAAAPPSTFGSAGRSGIGGSGGGGGADGGNGSGGHLNVRGDIHVLVVGDPGLGKSQMLRAASKASPRGVYISGGVTSKTGLTVTMVRDGKASGDFALEAGALVLADQGVCCIDEFDKMSAEHSALLEAMEQQSISIAKAGMVCSLAARASVIAAANPVGGHYQRSKTLTDNLKIANPLLSRFDLVFILLDQPDLDRDQRLSEHIVKVHGTKKSKKKRRRQQQGEEEEPEEEKEEHPFPLTPPRRSGGPPTSFDSPSSIAAERPLARKLRVMAHDPDCQWKGIRGHEELDVLPVSALRKYIAYARKYCRPLLSAAARATLCEFFLSLRARAALSPADSTPVTTRQLEALVRLCEARARADLQEVVTASHAQDIVDLLKESRADLAEADGGTGGSEALAGDLACASATMASARGGGRAGSKAALKKKFVALLRRKAELKPEPIFSGRELYELHESAGLKHAVDDFDAFIDALNTDNYLLKVGARNYKLVAGVS